MDDSTDFFFSLRGKGTDDYNEKLDFLLNGDLCTTIFTDEECVEGVARKGILGINSYMTSAISELKQAYEQSNKTEAAKSQVLSMKRFLKAEDVYWFNSIKAFEQITLLLRENIWHEVDNFKENTRLIISMFSVAFVLLCLVLWLPVWRLLYLKERRVLSDTILMVPI